MTRHHAAILSGLSVGTLIRRVWEGWPTEYLFCHFKNQKLPFTKIRQHGESGLVRSRYSENNLILPYAEFKKQKQQERAFNSSDSNSARLSSVHLHSSHLSSTRRFSK
jgi:hypothetical protein